MKKMERMKRMKRIKKLRSRWLVPYRLFESIQFIGSRSSFWMNECTTCHCTIGYRSCFIINEMQSDKK